MSRSFHITRRDLKEEHSRLYSDEEKRSASIRQLKEDLEKKRRAKKYARYDRKGSFPEAPVTPIETIPFEIYDSSEYLHYPASADDIIGLLNTMPACIIDGLSQISFGLGDEMHSSSDSPWIKEPEKDPFLGRIGYEALPGVYAGSCLGVYYIAKAEIRLHGYVYSPELPDRPMWELYLRLYTLMTFVHEAGHHYDFTFRLSHDRWRGDSRDNAEIYAETMQHKWLNKHIIPFLQKKYPKECEALNTWIKRNVGVEVPFPLLAGDPRSTGKNGSIRISSFFDTAEAFREFVRDTYEPCDPVKARLEFADSLHMAEKYDLALGIIELILDSKPKHVKAITLKADIYEHFEKYDEAIAVAQQALSIDSGYIDAYRVLLNCYKGLEKWQKVIESSDIALELISSAKSWHYGSVLYSKAEALLELGNHQEAEKIITDLEGQGRRTEIMAKRLRKKFGECSAQNIRGQ